MRALVLLLTLVGCSSVPVLQQDGVLYKKDIRLYVNNVQYIGTAVLPAQEKYRISVEALGKLDLLTFTTCHREIIKEHAGEGGFFGDSRKTDIKYKPDPKEEKDKYCPVQIAGYEMKRGRHSWGFIDFITPETNLSAITHCNGKVTDNQGVSICQAKKGLNQSIIFTEEVTVIPRPDCILDPINGANRVTAKEFNYQMPEGVCVYAFMTKGGKVHRHTTIGYSQIMIREL